MNSCTRTCGEYAASRWARLVTIVVASPTDVPRQAHWAEAANTSVSALRMTCRLVREYPKESLDLGRLLGAVRRGQEDPTGKWDLSHHIVICHEETLERFVRMGALNDAIAAGRAPSLREFLGAQKLVTTAANLRVLWREMERLGLTAPAPSAHLNNKRDEFRDKFRLPLTLRRSYLQSGSLFILTVDG